MKVVIEAWEDSYGCLRHERMKVDGKNSLSVHPLCECPEDAIIGRDLVGCCDVADLMQMAHAAGIAGEPFICDVIDVEGDE